MRPLSPFKSQLGQFNMQIIQQSGFVMVDGWMPEVMTIDEKDYGIVVMAHKPTRGQKSDQWIPYVSAHRAVPKDRKVPDVFGHPFEKNGQPYKTQLAMVHPQINLSVTRQIKDELMVWVTQHEAEILRETEILHRQEMAEVVSLLETFNKAISQMAETIKGLDAKSGLCQQHQSLLQEMRLQVNRYDEWMLWAEKRFLE